MLSDNHQVQLADFGSAVLTGDFSLGFTPTDPKFTLRFASPELLGGTSEHTTKTDIYALSMTILSILTGKRPFPNKRDHAIVAEVLIHKNRPPLSDFPIFAGRDRLWGLLERCWAHTPEDRPTATEVSHALIEVERGVYEPWTGPCSRNILDYASSSEDWSDSLIVLIDASVFFFFFLLSILGV
ncbi:unnamed protein product [Rhizoctonia solani]|nr:unnamed protein product [Rhizoctonia solani]